MTPSSMTEAPGAAVGLRGHRAAPSVIQSWEITVHVKPCLRRFQTGDSYHDARNLASRGSHSPHKNFQGAGGAPLRNFLCRHRRLRAYVSKNP